MFTVIVEKEDGFRNKETYTLEPDYSSLTYEAEGFNKKSKPVKKTISQTDIKKINEAFSALDFSKIFKETDDLLGMDGWTLTCTLEFRMNQVSVDVWCPNNCSSKPETAKLVKACELLESVFKQANDSSKSKKKTLYVEPEGYFTESAKKILEGKAN